MAKIQRKSAKIFAEQAQAAVGGIAQFGSLAAGNIQYSKDVDVIQALDAYKNGWASAVVGNKSPAMEDRNALDYLLSYQQAYIMQRGVPEWLSTETYYVGSFVSLDNGRMYVSKVDNNTNHDPSTDTSETYWVAFPTPQELADGLALKVAKAGDTMTGNLIMNGGTVYNRVSGTDYRVLDSRDLAKSTQYSMPNYSAGVTYSTNTVITVPSDGWFVFLQNTGNYSAASISIWTPEETTYTDETRVAYFYYRNYNDSNTATIPVPKGYKVQFTTTYGYQLTFYPCMGAN